MARDNSWVVGLVALGVLGVVACGTSSSSKPGSVTQNQDAGCTGALCGGGGGMGGGTSGAGGTVGASAGGTPAVDQCTVLHLDQGATSPDGIFALHSPPPNTFSDPYGGMITVSGGFVYFDYKSELTRVPVAGGAPESIHAVKSSNERFFVIGGDVVWVDQDPTTLVYSILKAPASASGSDSGAPFVVADPIEEPDYIVSDSTAVYFSSRKTSIWYKAPLDGSGVTQVTTNAEALGAVVESGTLYWIDFNTSQVMSVPTTGGQGTPLVSVFFGGPMVAEGSTLYWDDTSQETVNRWSPGDKNPTVLAHFGPFEGAGTIAVKSGDVYYTREGFGCGGVSRIPSDGSKATLVANGFDSASDLAVDADNVYVVAWNGVFRFHR